MPFSLPDTSEAFLIFHPSHSREVTKVSSGQEEPGAKDDPVVNSRPSHLKRIWLLLINKTLTMAKMEEPTEIFQKAALK